MLLSMLCAHAPCTREAGRDRRGRRWERHCELNGDGTREVVTAVVRGRVRRSGLQRGVGGFRQIPAESDWSTMRDWREFHVEFDGD